MEMDFVTFEDFILHANRAKVGMVRLESWGLPDDICVPVGMHHVKDVSVVEDIPSRIVFPANLLIENMDILLTEPCRYNFDLRSYEESEDIMREVPKISGNRERIMDDFFQNYSEGLPFL